MKRPWLMPLVPLWAAGAAWKNRAYDRMPFKAQNLQRPVLSVGSLSAGGAGKTPFVIALARALEREGMACDVLSRGYGRTVQTAVRVTADGSADSFGDEPLLIARALHVPVYVSPRRLDAGRLAEADITNAATVHLVDDGFQHRQLARSIDIVLVTAQDVRDTLLPAGDLREPLSSLRRADVLVVRDEERTAVQHGVTSVFAGLKQPPLWTIQRRFVLPDTHVSPRPLAFCGIARPDGFRAALQQHGISPAGFVALRDHQRYDPQTIQRLLDAARQSGATGFVTTAKDAVKLLPGMREALQAVGPFAIGDVEVQLHNETQCVHWLMQRLAHSSP